MEYPDSPAVKQILHVVLLHKEIGWVIQPYTFPYRETTRDQHILRKHKNLWKVYETLRPQPGTSIPNRRKYA